MIPFPQAAETALDDAQLRHNLARATRTIRDKRAAVVAEVPDWEALRQAGRQIKDRVLKNLDHYLVQLEQSVRAAGGEVHWARDGAEANALVARLIEEQGATEVVKSKSITTDEIGLNIALAARGIKAIETDLAELIIQLAGETSSHILVPAIHKNRSEIREVFIGAGLASTELSDRPEDLAETARRYLRERFLRASIGISGANFAVAETGTVCLVESEGNARMCTTLPWTLITVMGIEKVIPEWQDLGVMLQLCPDRRPASA